MALTNREKQAAWRARQTANKDRVAALEQEVAKLRQTVTNQAGATPERPSGGRRQSRPARWQNACADAERGLEELVALVEEYTQWRENLPDNLSAGTLAEKLDAITELEFGDALATVQEAAAADLPRGFGND